MKALLTQKPINTAILLAGITGLGLQIMAGRLFAPEFGSSVFTWGSIIGVFMIALSLGYHVGGQQSKHSSKSLFTTTMLIASIFILILAYFGEGLTKLLGSITLPPQYAALPAVVVLFGPVIFLLGSLIPHAIALSKHEQKGFAAGEIFTRDTIGSIIGTFSVTFILIPLATTQTVFAILGIILLVALFFLEPSREKMSIAVVFCILFIVSIVAQGASANSSSNIDINYGSSFGVNYVTQTLYQKLQVTDRFGNRVLYLDDHPQSAMNLEDKDAHVFRYTPYFHVPFLINPDIEKVLFIGAGGFTGPKEFQKMGLEVTAVELDQGVVDAAIAYFEVNDSLIDIHVIDGREFLQRNEEKYDLIILDAYRKDRVPFHLTTQEFYDLVASRLTDDGIVFSNIIAFAEGEQSLFFRTKFATMNSVFPHAYAFRTYNFERIENVLLVGTKMGPELTKDEFISRAAQNLTYIDVSEQVALMMNEVETGDVEILVDNKAPVDALLTSIIGEEFLFD